MTKDRGTQMKIKAKRLKIEHNFLPSHFGHEDNSITIVLQSQTVAFHKKSLTLLDYNNKMPEMS